MAERYQPTDPPRTGSVVHAPEGRGPEAAVASSDGKSRSLEWAAGLRVRMALEADVPSIAALERASFSDPWSQSSFHSFLDRPEVHMTVAECQKERIDCGVVGYMVAWFIGHEGEIANIAVAVGWQRRGVGATLLDDVLAAGRAAGVRSMYLEVRASNSGAQALYAGRGFRAVGSRRRYYSNPTEDALVLKWQCEHLPADA